MASHQASYFPRSHNNMSTSRKTHRKSRTGCGHCKRRKIKCDEQKPACLNCVKHAIQCDFPPVGSSRESTRDASPSSKDHYPMAPMDSFRPSDYSRERSLNTAVAIDDDHNNRPLDLNMMDLKLLHHFTTSTCYTLSQKPQLRVLWQVTVPQIAFEQDFLMRSLLAVSALHLSRFGPHEKREHYSAQMVLQRDLALNSVRSAMSNVTKENSNALFVFGTMVVVITFGQPRVPGPLAFTEPGDQLAEWLFLLRGVHPIIVSAWEWIEGGELTPLLTAGQNRAQHVLGAPESDRLMQLSHLIRENTTDETDLKTYNVAMEKLEECFAITYAPDDGACDPAPAFMWPIVVSDGYMELLRKHMPLALAIFGHYCILLNKLDGFWWVQGWGTNLISTIYSLLGNAHRAWIRWPIQECGWIPPTSDD